MMALSRPARSAGFLQHAKKHTREPCFAVHVHRSRVLVLHELIICSACSLSGMNIFSSFVSRCWEWESVTTYTLGTLPAGSGPELAEAKNSRIRSQQMWHRKLTQCTRLFSFWLCLFSDFSFFSFRSTHVLYMKRFDKINLDSNNPIWLLLL